MSQGTKLGTQLFLVRINSLIKMHVLLVLFTIRHNTRGNSKFRELRCRGEGKWGNLLFDHMSISVTPHASVCKTVSL